MNIDVCLACLVAVAVLGGVTGNYAGTQHDCPSGFFSTPGFRTACYKLYDDKYRDWTEAFDKCTAEKLILAHPLNSVAVRKHLVDVMGVTRWVQIGAKGNGENMVWLDNLQKISKNSPLWDPTHTPTGSVGTDICLNLMSDTKPLKDNPNEVFFPAPCAWKQYTLCQSCPEGFFRTDGSHQCYKLYNDIYRDWYNASAKCQSENLILAEPLNPVSVRRHLVEDMGITCWVHIGAKGNGVAIVWLNNLQQISLTSSLWAHEQPTATSIFTNVGLNLMSDTGPLKEYPNQPFFPAPVAWEQYTLCQIPM